MFRKLFVFVVSTLVLCPQVNASTFTFSNPAGGTVWNRTDTVTATGSTNVPGGDKIIMRFGYYTGITENIEDSVTHTVIGGVGLNTWTASITAPPVSCWFGFCWGGWRLSPTYSPAPPPIIKDHFVKVEDFDPVLLGKAWRNDQGVVL